MVIIASWLTRAVLTFSYVGYSTETRSVGSSDTINVTMSEDVAQLEEVVVTAQGITRERKALGYTVSEVAGEEMEQELKVMLPEYYLVRHQV